MVKGGRPSAWRVADYQNREAYVAKIAGVLRDGAFLAKCNITHFCVPVRNVWPHKIHESPSPTVCSAFARWLYGYASDRWESLLCAIQRMPKDAGLHDDLLLALKRLRASKEWDALRANIIGPYKKGGQAYRADFAEAWVCLCQRSGVADASTCGNLLPEEAHAYCWEDLRFTWLPELRLRLLKETGFQHIASFEPQWKETSEILAKYRQGAYGKKYPGTNLFPTYFKLAKVLGEVPEIALASSLAIDIAAKLKEYAQGVPEEQRRYKCQAMRSMLDKVAVEADCSTLLRQLEPLLDPVFRTISFFQWLQGQSEWHAQHLESILQRLLECHTHVTFDNVKLENEKKLVSIHCNALRKFVLGQQAAGCIKISDIEPFQWFVENATANLAVEAVRHYVAGIKVNNSRVKTEKVVHHGLARACDMVRFMKYGLQPSMPIGVDLSCLNAKAIVSTIPNQRVPKQEEVRRTFTDDEVAAMMKVVETDVRWTFILTVLREIGLRVSSICHLKYRMLLDETHMPRHVCRVPEKGCCWRSFITSPKLKATIKAYSDHLRQNEETSAPDTEAYMLLGDTPGMPCDPSIIRKQLLNIAKAARVSEVHVHPHAFRHTIVGKLIEAGNPLELVSKYMGHRQVTTTSANYWVPTAMELGASMNNPFTGEFQRKAVQAKDTREEVQVLEAKVDAAVKLLCRQTSILRAAASTGETAARALQIIETSMPEAEDILRSILENSATTSVITDDPRQIALLELELQAEAPLSDDDMVEQEPVDCAAAPVSVDDEDDIVALGPNHGAITEYHGPGDERRDTARPSSTKRRRSA